MNKDSWEIKMIGEVFDLYMGRTPSRSNPMYWGDNTGYKWVSISDIGNEKYIQTTKEFISELGKKESKIKVVPKGTVIMSFKLSIGKVAITAEDMYTNEAIMAFHPINSNIFEKNYIYYYLKGYDWIGSNRAVMGTTLNKFSISNYKIVIPPIAIQEQIVKELDTLSDIITKKKEQLAELDKLAQATFYDMFGDPVENEKQWKTEKLDTLCTKITDGEHFRPETTSEGIPFLSAKDILQEGISFKNALFVTQETAKKALRRCNPEKNDILIVSRGATVGRMNIVKTDQVFCLLGSVILLKFKPNELSSYFLLQTLRNPDVLNKIRGLSSSSAQQALYLKDLKLLSIPVPPLFLQNQFAKKIEAIEQQKELINKSITDVQLLFDYTMDKYFN